MKLTVDAISKSSGIQRISTDLVERSQTFCDLVADANRKINLVSRAGGSEGEIATQFLLSVAALHLIPANEPLRWLDIGSGGGFPALPLAIFRPKIFFVLAESIAKKAFFLERTVEALMLANVKVNHHRIEDHGAMASPEGHQYDWVSVKAVADWKKTVRMGSGFLRPSGFLLTYKPFAPSEIEVKLAAKHGLELESSSAISDVVPGAAIQMILMRKSP